MLKLLLAKLPIRAEPLLTKSSENLPVYVQDFFNRNSFFCYHFEGLKMFLNKSDKFSLTISTNRLNNNNRIFGPLEGYGCFSSRKGCPVPLATEIKDKVKSAVDYIGIE